MGYFNLTLVLFKEKKHPKTFLVDFHKKLKTISIILEKDDYEIIVFNDSIQGEEKEPIELNESMTDEDVINLVCFWKGLGMLSYRHPNFRYAFSINYLTWDDKFIDGFDIGFYSSEFRTNEDDKNHRKIISEIGNLVEYECIVGDIGNVSNHYIDLKQDLTKIKEIIKNKTFDIDSRK